MRKHTLAPIATLMLGFLTVLSANAQELVDHGTFDSSVDGWTSIEDPDPDGDLFWSDSMGQPPGALEGRGGVNIVTESCFPVFPGYVTIAADVFEQGTVICNVLVAWFLTDDCTGAFGTPQDFGFPTSRDAWEPVRFTTAQFTPQALSFKPLLSASTDPMDPNEACFFDNVSLIQQVQAPPIPTLDAAGLSVSVVLTLLAGLWVLRGRMSS